MSTGDYVHLYRDTHWSSPAQLTICSVSPVCFSVHVTLPESWLCVLHLPTAHHLPGTYPTWKAQLIPACSGRYHEYHAGIQVGTFEGEDKVDQSSESCSFWGDEAPSVLLFKSATISSTSSFWNEKDKNGRGTIFFTNML